MWQARVAVDNAKALLPFQAALRRIARRLRPYEGNPDNYALTVEQGLGLIVSLRAAGAELSGDVVELGTGWFPIVPRLFGLLGARLLITDQERLIDAHTIATADGVVLHHAERVAAVLGVDQDRLREHLRAPLDARYAAPWVPAHEPTASADIVFSRAVLEHVPPAVLSSMLGEFHRILRPNGLMGHIIDNSDHFAHRDRSLSMVNFLRFSDAAWWLTGINPQNYQNRLRHSDYLTLIEASGFEILTTSGEADPRSHTDGGRLPLAPRFRRYDPADLAVLTSTIIARRRG